MTTPEAAPHNPPDRSWRRWLHRAVSAGVFLLLVLALAGFVLRDRWHPAAALTYLPLAHIAAAALVWDLILRGRSLGRRRFTLAVIAALLLVVAARSTVGFARTDAPLPATDSIRIFHWNVKWGGSYLGGEAHWPSVLRTIDAAGPDVIVLSEAPLPSARSDVENPIRAGWPIARWAARRERYGWSLLVTSRWPLTDRWRRPIAGGVAMRVDLATDAGTLRMLVVDGETSPLRDRRPFLAAIAEIVRNEAAAGEPIDLIAGDFNAPGRSVGFDALYDPLGYRAAGACAASIRGTWPSVLPLVDVDHVLVSPRLRILGCDRLADLRSDHTAQLVRVQRQAMN